MPESKIGKLKMHSRACSANVWQHWSHSFTQYSPVKVEDTTPQQVKSGTLQHLVCIKPTGAQSAPAVLIECYFCRGGRPTPQVVAIYLYAQGPLKCCMHTCPACFIHHPSLAGLRGGLAARCQIGIILTRVHTIVRSQPATAHPMESSLCVSEC